MHKQLENKHVDSHRLALLQHGGSPYKGVWPFTVQCELLALEDSDLMVICNLDIQLQDYKHK